MMRAAVVVLAAVLTGCGGSVSQSEIVAACGAQILPRVRACIPVGYQGIDAEPLRACIVAQDWLVRDLRQCRDEEPAAFATYYDYRAGHEARVLLESLTETSP